MESQENEAASILIDRAAVKAPRMSSARIHEMRLWCKGKPMCGIAGYWGGRVNMPPDEAAGIGTAMAGALAHRGPDDCGVWSADHAPCLVHRRLSIIDLSTAGRQPMISGDGRFVLVFNGEIYNFRDLRKEVEAAGMTGWRGHSDTEALLEAISLWGIGATLPRLNGMFAIAVWDRLSASLTLARDRFGEKPLYYGYAASSFLFGSELKALYAHPAWRGKVDADALADYLRLCYVPAPRSIFKNVRKLMPGTAITMGWTDVAQRAWPEPRQYWNAQAAVADIVPARGSDEDFIVATEQQLRSAVSLRMVSDVPLGAFLSGGVDSSLITAMMQAESVRPVKTFSIGFHDSRYNEADAAAKVANHLGTDHTEMYVGGEDVIDAITQIPAVYDEPFADSSQIPTIILSQLTRRHVTVALTGDGGDEVFGGYNRHTWVPKIWHLASRMPYGLRARIGAFLQRRTPAELDAAFARMKHLMPAPMHARTPGDKLHKLANALKAAGPLEIYVGLVSTIQEPHRYLAVAAGGTDCQALFPLPPKMPLQQWMMLLDTQNYMADDILPKVDRASMSVGLETRIPFLDPELYRWAWKMPPSMKIRNGRGKWVLREVLYRYVPKDLVDRPKTGFGIPLDQMLRSPLRDWAFQMLEPTKLARHALLNPKAVQEALHQHMAGRANNAHLLWNLIVLNAWVDSYGKYIELPG